MKILYYSNVPWSWIKQRPQFIAEELSLSNDVTVVYTHAFGTSIRLKISDTLRVCSLLRLPYERIKLISKINRFLYVVQLLFYARNTEIIWLTSPYQYRLIKTVLKRQRIVYDCMDDIMEFPNADKQRKELTDKEKDLCINSNYIIASSSFLKQKLIKRYGNLEICVINNAIKSVQSAYISELSQEYNSYFNDEDFIISYIGTISEWMDWELLKKLTLIAPKIKINLFGPCSLTVPHIENVRICGSVPHDMVFSIMSKSDVLIMPFLVTELIESVNPVKLYEYIYSGKPCLAPLYGESIQFSEFVYLYEDHRQCCEIVNKILNNTIGSKKNKEACVSFAKENTWHCRVKQIKDYVNI